MAGLFITDGTSKIEKVRPRAVNSFKHFHPDADVFTFDINDEKEILGEVKVPPTLYPTGAVRPRFIKHLLKNYDTVIYLDADTVTAARLDEFLTGDFDVAGSLNVPLPHNDKFCNCGVMAVRSKEFCEQWERGLYDPKPKRSNQPIFNALFRSNLYTSKIVDDKFVYYNERSRPYWGNITIVGDKLFCNGRWLKVLHWAGGFTAHKTSFKGFIPEVRHFLNWVTKTNDFTENKGKARWY